MKTYFLLSLLLTSPLLFAQADHAGNGSSGGGHIYGNQLNPWFIQNTAEVKYCVSIAPEFSTLSKAEVLRHIDSAFAYWKTVFAGRGYDNAQDFDFQAAVGTQAFTYVEKCSPQVDIKFQLGHLSTQQKRQIPNYRQLIGVAQRTSYDEVKLRGKGFIYLAPEHGELRPLGVNRHPTPWSSVKGIILRAALIHEIGHTFGLQDDHYEEGTVMSARFVDEVTTIRAVTTIAQAKSSLYPPSPLGCNDSFEGRSEEDIEVLEFPAQESDDGNLIAALWKFIGLTEKKYKLIMTTANNLLNIEVNGRAFGTIDLTFYDQLNKDESPTVNLYLTHKQQVYKGLPAEAFHTPLTLYWTTTSALRKTQVLKLKNGNELKVFLKYDRRCWPTISTVFKGEIIFDIFDGK